MPSPPKKRKADGYSNPLTGIGDYLQDKTFGGTRISNFMLGTIIGRECEDRWRGSDLGARVVECVPDEMVREGWEVTIQPDKGDEEGVQETIEDMTGRMDVLGVPRALWTALCYERCFGGAVVMMGIDDGQKLTEPLAEDRIRSISYLNVFNGGKNCEAIARTYYTDMRSTNYGKPETYTLRNIGVPAIAPIGAPRIVPYESQFDIHESRLLVFPGNVVSRRAAYEADGFGDSIFTRVDEILSQYNQTWGGIAVLMTEFSQAVLKVPEFRAALAGRNKASAPSVTQRALAIQQTRSIARMLFIDSDEEFERNTATLTGISDVLQQFALRLAAAADMPVTLLMGQSPAGLNATGESDIRFFYDRIAAKQRQRLLPQLTRLVKLMFLAKDGPTKGIEPDRWNVKFNPLYQASEKEQADIRKVVAETDQIYINTQVLSPEEVAASAYGGSEWTMERTIDVEARNQMAQQQESIMSEAAKAKLKPNELAIGHPERPVEQPKPNGKVVPK